MPGAQGRTRRKEGLASPLSLGLLGERCYCGRLDLPPIHELRAHPEFRTWLRGQVAARRMTPSGRLLAPTRARVLEDFDMEIDPRSPRGMYL